MSRCWVLGFVAGALVACPARAGGEVNWRARIFERSALGNDSMPPGTDDPPAAERRRLAEWLACGAP